MKEIKIVPSVCEGKKPTFEGHIIITAPTFDERYEYVESCQVKTDEHGKPVKDVVSQLPMIRKMVKLSEKHYKEVALKRLHDGQEFKSFEDMSYEPECASILVEVATQILNGNQPSKK